MKVIPSSVDGHISNAEYFLEAAEKHPSPTKDAVHLMLLLIGWENIIIADKELNAWARDEDIDEKLYKSHMAKLRDVPGVTRIGIDHEGNAKEIYFSSGRQFEQLRMACQYGSNTEGVNVKELFRFGWHLQDLRNGLLHKIDWLKTSINAFKALENSK